MRLAQGVRRQEQARRRLHRGSVRARRARGGVVPRRLVTRLVSIPRGVAGGGARIATGERVRRQSAAGRRRHRALPRGIAHVSAAPVASLSSPNMRSIDRTTRCPPSHLARDGRHHRAARPPHGPRGRDRLGRQGTDSSIDRERAPHDTRRPSHPHTRCRPNRERGSLDDEASGNPCPERENSRWGAEPQLTCLGDPVWPRPRSLTRTSTRASHGDVDAWQGTAAAKFEAMEHAGVHISRSPAQLGACAAQRIVCPTLHRRERAERGAPPSALSRPLRTGLCLTAPSAHRPRGVLPSSHPPFDRLARRRRVSHFALAAAVCRTGKTMLAAMTGK